MKLFFFVKIPNDYLEFVKNQKIIRKKIFQIKKNFFMKILSKNLTAISRHKIHSKNSMTTLLFLRNNHDRLVQDA